MRSGLVLRDRLAPTWFVGFALVSCGGDGPAAGPRNPTQPGPDRTATSLTLSPDSSWLFAGRSVLLSPTIQFSDGTTLTGVRGGLTWTTSNPDVATVTSDGEVSGVGAGFATISAARDGATGTAVLTVNPSVSRNVELPPTPGVPVQEEPHLALANDGLLMAFWKVGDDSGWRWVAAAHSLDGGTVWSTPVRVPLAESEGPDSFQSDPWLATSSGAARYRAYLEIPPQYDGENSRILVSRSSDGITWASPVDVDSRSGFADKPSADVAPDGTVYVAHLNCLSGGNDCQIIVARSGDGGRTWSSSVVAENGASPVVAAGPGGRVYCAYWDITITGSSNIGHLNIVSSLDGGASWTVPSRVNPFDLMVPYRRTPISQRPAGPSIALAPSGAVLLAWPGERYGQPTNGRQTEGWDVWVSRSEDGGSTWSENRVNDTPVGDQWMPAMTVGPDGIAHVAFYDSRGGDATVAYSSSADEGRTWSPDMAMATEGWDDVSLRVGDYLGITADGAGTAYVAWTDRRLPGIPGIRVRFARSGWE